MKPPDDKNPHGNSKKSRKKQHIYEIKDKSLVPENDTHKYGVSGSELNKDGTSKRANAQVNKKNRVYGWKRFWAIILGRDIDGREKALEEEKELVAKYKKKNRGKMPSGMKRPNPKNENDES